MATTPDYTSAPPAPVTLKDIAQRCGTTQATVSRALRQSGELNAQTISQICAVAAEMGYDPERFHQARRLAVRRSGRRLLNNQVAVILPAYFHATHYFSAIFNGILNAITPEHYGLVMAFMPDSRVESHPFELPSSISREEVDGVILLGGNPNGDDVLLPMLRPYLHPQRCPLVSLMSPTPGATVSVQADYVVGSYAAARHLLELGHRHLLYVYDGIELDPFHRKMRGIARALAEPWEGETPTFERVNAPDVPVVPFHRPPAQPIVPEDHPLVRLLRAHPQFTGVMVENDLFAHRIWYLLRNAGWRIPEDLSLIGHDDTDAILDETGSMNILTSVHLPLDEVGKRAGETLLALIRGEDVPENEIMLPATLTIRQTTGACRRVKANG